MPLGTTEAQIYYLHSYFLKSPFVTHEASIIERVFSPLVNRMVT